MISDRLFTAHLKVFNMANLFDRPMVDAPEKMGPGMEDSVDSRKEPSVDHCGAQWNALHIGVINNLKKWVRVAEVPSYRFSTFFHLY